MRGLQQLGTSVRVQQRYNVGFAPGKLVLAACNSGRLERGRGSYGTLDGDGAARVLHVGGPASPQLLLEAPPFPKLGAHKRADPPSLICACQRARALQNGPQAAVKR